MDSDTGEVTRLLVRLRAGDSNVHERLIELVYNELRQMAAARLRRERPEHTLTPTALVHEAYLRFGAGPRDGFLNRGHFLAVASQAMRRVLVDHARARNAVKRSSNQVELLENIPCEMPDAVTIALDAALRDLEAVSRRASQIVEMRFFGALTETEVAEALGLTRRTVNRDWRMARAWLHARIGALDV